MNLKERIISNTSSHIAAYLISAIIRISLMPFIIHRIGIIDYGLFILIGSITNYAGLLDLQLGTSITKHVAEFHAKKDHDSIISIFTNSLLYYLSVGIVVFFTVVFSKNLIISFFNIDPAITSKAYSLIYLTATGMLLSFPFSVYNAILGGLQRYDITARLNIFSIILSSIATVLVLNYGYGVVEILFVQLVFGNLIEWLGNYFYAAKIAYPLHFKFSSLSKNGFNRIFIFGSQMLLIRIAGVIIFKTDYLVIGKFLSVGMITMYQVAFSLFSFFERIPNLLIKSLMPAVSELAANNQHERIRHLFLRLTKYVISVFLVISIPVFVFSDNIMTIWMGTDFIFAGMLTRLFFIYLFFTINHFVGSQILVGIANVKNILWYFIIVAFSNLFLSILLVQYIGLVGVVLGTVIPFVLFEFYYLNFMFKSINISWTEYYTNVIKSSYGIAFIMFLLLTTISYFSKSLGVIQLAVYCMASVILHSLLYYFYNLNVPERHDIKMLFAKLLKRPSMEAI